MNDLENNSFLFADDSTIVKQYARSQEQVAADSINTDLSKVAKWAKKWNVTFNITKTVFINFSSLSDDFLFLDS